MDKDKLNILNDFFKSNRNKCFGLKNWLEIKNKNFKLIDALECIYDYSKGNFNEMNTIIDHLINYQKRQGRTQVYADDVNPQIQIDIIKNGSNLELVNYNPNKELNRKGQALQRNPRIFRKKDDQTNQLYKNTEARLMDIGASVRKLYPNVSTPTITFIIQAVRKYAQDKKIHTDKVLKKLESGDIVFDPRLNILKNAFNENKIIVINEDTYNSILNSEDLEMSEYKFYSNIKHFLAELLDDPVNAQPSFLLKKYGLNRSKLIQQLLNNNIIIKDEKISDTDENGEYKTATMKVKFLVPKKDFKYKLKKIYIKNFEKNLPSSYNDVITEDGEGGAVNGGCFGGATSAVSSGAYEQPAFNIQRRNFSTVTETDTNSVGNYQYDVPFLGDKETLSRKNGVNGSISINKM